jgi:hypothetical protein
MNKKHSYFEQLNTIPMRASNNTRKGQTRKLFDFQLGVCQHFCNCFKDLFGFLFSEKKQMLKIKDLQDGKDFDANMP